MNPDMTHERPVWHVGFGFVAASFLFAALVLALKFSISPAAIDADRAVERSRDLAQVRAAEAQALDNAAWIDPQRGLVRLPIDVAMQITAQLWQKPAQARADLIAREEKAAAPAPAAPAKSNVFE